MDGLYDLLDYFVSFSPYKPSGAPFQGLVICSHQCLSHVTSLTRPAHFYYLCLSLVTSHISLKFLDLYCEMFLSFIFYLFLFFFLCFFVSSFLPFSFPFLFLLPFMVFTMLCIAIISVFIVIVCQGMLELNSSESVSLPLECILRLPAQWFCT